MCGRYAVFTDEENEKLRAIVNGIEEQLKKNQSDIGSSSSLPFVKTGEIFPTDPVPVIISDSENKKAAILCKWGFPNQMKAGAVIINARCETLHEKPTFRNLLRSGRCLVPASGFYEWNKAVGSPKEKYLIRAANSPLIYFAGLYGSFVDKSGIRSTRFVIITTDANMQMAGIHNRMPVILDRSNALRWLNAGIPADEILKPYPDELIFSKI